MFPIEFQIALEEAANAYGLPMSADERALFSRYYMLLMQGNQKTNLTAITAPKEVAIKHIIDSLTALRGADFSGMPQVVDVGTGAGFPGLPLKIHCPQIQLTLIDSLGKRIAFLEEATEVLGLQDVRILHLRAEDAGRDKTLREQFDIVVSRAVARLPVLLEYLLPLAKVGGYAVALKGMAYQEELTEAQKALQVLGGQAQAIPIQLPELTDKRAVIAVKKIKATPKNYPRRAGTPQKLPLR